MGKVDFSKVEKFLDSHSKKVFIQKIIALTEKEKKSAEEFQEKIKNKHMGNVLRSLKKDLERLSEKSEKMWEELGVSKDEVAKFISNPGKLSKEDREVIGILMEKVQEYKKSTGSSIEKEVNEDLIQSERKRHHDQRMNVNKKWKPV